MVNRPLVARMAIDLESDEYSIESCYVWVLRSFVDITEYDVATRRRIRIDQLFSCQLLMICTHI